MVANGTIFLGDFGAHSGAKEWRRGSVAFPVAMFVADCPTACSSRAGGAMSPATPQELCSSPLLPATRLPDPAPAPHLQTVKLFFLRQTKRQSLPRGACGQGEEMPCYLVSSLFSTSRAADRLQPQRLEAGPASSDS